MEWVIHLLRQHSELAIFLTIAAGFWIGKIKVGQFSLGIVTSVLLVGVLVGQLNITIEEPVKSVFFLLFLFAIGYKVGPQFFRGLKKDGLPQVGFAVLMCVGCLVITWILALIMGYNAGEAAGLLAGAQTISAVIGVADDTINGLNISTEQKNNIDKYYSRSLCCYLYLRNCRVSMGTLFFGSENVGRTGKSKSCL